MLTMENQEGNGIFKMIIVGVNIKQDSKYKIEDQLAFLLKNIDQQYFDVDVVLNGYLNSNREKAIEIGERLNLILTRNIQGKPTRV